MTPKFNPNRAMTDNNAIPNSYIRSSGRSVGDFNLKITPN